MDQFWMDGNPTELSDEQVRLFDSANPENFGVFETLRTYGGKIFKVSEHLARLERSAKLLGLTLPVTSQAIAEYLEKTVQGSKESSTELRLKCIATPEHVFVKAVPLSIDPNIYKGVSAISINSTRAQPTAKALPYDISFNAHELAEQKGAYEAILVDENGLVTEGAYSNIFWVKDGKIYTRKDGVLEGITRKVVLELVPVEFQNITLEELKKVDELFLTKTTTGPVPIVSVDGKTVGEGKPGAMTSKIIKSFGARSGT